MITMLAALLLFQDPPLSKKSEEKEVIVTATKREIPLEEVGVSASILNGPSIERRQKRDVLQLLREVPGLSVVQTGSRGGTTDLFVRGAEANHNLVMIDGFHINRGGGAFDFANLTVDNLDRIEVVRGASSSLYGSDAVASAINLISRRGEGPPRVELRAMGGSRHTIEERLLFSGGEEKFGYSMSVGRYDTHGYLPFNNDAHNTSGRLRFDLRATPDLSVGVTTVYTDSEFHFPTDFVSGQGFPPVDPRQGRETRELIAGTDVAYHAAVWWDHRLKVGVYDVSIRDFDPLDPIPSDFANQQTLALERRVMLDYRELFSVAPGSGVTSTLTIGIEVEGQTFRQNRSSIPPSGTPTTTAVDNFRRTVAGYAQEEVAIEERLFLTAGLRLDENSEFGSSVNPRGSIAYLVPATRTKLRASGGTGIKEPSFLENFGLGASLQGNPELDPERSISWDVGIDQTLGENDATLSVTYFQNRFRDLVAFVSSGAVSTWENIQGAVSYGLETSLSVRIAGPVRTGATYTLLRTRVTDDGGQSDTAFVAHEDLLRRPRHSGSAFVDLDAGGVRANLAAIVVGSRIDRDFATSFSGTRVRLDGYLRLDLAVSYRVWENLEGRRSFDLRLLIQNLLDKDYREVFSTRSPGLSLLAGVEGTF
jgi:vitamin B12 transporter